MTTPREEMAEREKMRDADEQRAARLSHAMRSVAASADGRIVLRWIYGLGNPLADTFQPSAMAAYESGKKFIPRRLWRELEKHADRNDFIAIFMEGESDA